MEESSSDPREPAWLQTRPPTLRAVLPLSCTFMRPDHQGLEASIPQMQCYTRYWHPFGWTHPEHHPRNPEVIKGCCRRRYKSSADQTNRVFSFFELKIKESIPIHTRQAEEGSSVYQSWFVFLSRERKTDKTLRKKCSYFCIFNMKVCFPLQSFKTPGFLDRFQSPEVFHHVPKISMQRQGMMKHFV